MHCPSASSCKNVIFICIAPYLSELKTDRLITVANISFIYASFSTVIILAALCSRCVHYILERWFLLSSSSYDSPMK